MMDDVLNEQLLLSIAGERSFERGEEYFENSSVRRLVERDNSIKAKVAGTNEYKVKLWISEDELL